jgi:hypothetical protein
VQTGPEVVVHQVRGEQVEVAPFLPWRNAGTGVTSELAADEVDHASLLGEQEPEPLEQLEGGGVERVAAGQARSGHAPTAECCAELGVGPLHPWLGVGAKADQPAPHEILDVAHREAERPIAVADARQRPLAHVGDLLDAFLEGGHDHHLPAPRPLAEELEEAQVLCQRRSLLRPQELAQLIEEDDEPGASGLLHRDPELVP